MSYLNFNQVEFKLEILVNVPRFLEITEEPHSRNMGPRIIESAKLSKNQNQLFICQKKTISSFKKDKSTQSHYYLPKFLVFQLKTMKHILKQEQMSLAQ